MEKLAILSLICSIPTLIFMLMAKIKGKNIVLIWLLFKFPSLISFVIMIIMVLSYFGFIKIQSGGGMADAMVGVQVDPK